MADTRIGKIGITPKGAWVPADSYEIFDVVLYAVENGGDGCSYTALKPSQGVRPGTDSTIWMKSSQAGQSIYDLAVKYKHFEGTEEEFEAEYQADLQSARDAATGASAVESRVEEAEASRVAAENARVSAETARGDAETARQSAETSRATAETTRQSAESNRDRAETTRQSAETTRESAETTRQSNEQAREGAELTRTQQFQALKTDMQTAIQNVDAKAAEIQEDIEGYEQNEAGRVSAEQGRVAAETARATAESARVSAEQGRATAETARQTAEGNRATAETERVSAEEARATAEQGRVSAESNRVGAEQSRVAAETARESQASSDHTTAVADHAIVQGYDTRLTNVEGEVSQLGQEVDNIVGRDGTIVKGYGIVPNEYVSASDGSFLPYNGWSRTDYVPIGDYSSIEIQGTTTGYNWLYDASKNPVANINLSFGHTINLANYPTAKYIVLSDSSANLANLVITAYGIKGNTLTNLAARVDTLESYDIPAILAELPEGYKLGGIVTPADSPDEDGMEKMFYIAKENGTYPNFGGVVVQDEVAVLYKTEDSANLLHLDTLIPNKYVDAQGNISAATGWTASQKMPVEVGTVYKVVALVNGVWTNMSSIWFALYDAQGAMTHRNVTTTNVLIDTQAGDKFVAVSWDTHTIGESPMLVPSTFVPTSYIEPNGWQKVTISKLDELSQTEIVLPSKLAFVQDKQFDMMVNNILYRGSAKNVGFKNLGSSTMYAYPYEDRIRINQPNEVISGTAVVRIQSSPDCAFDKNPAEQSGILSKSFTYRSVLKTQGSGVTKKVMFIGDSITANGTYPNEVVSLFSNDPMGVELIGTLGQSAKHEGRGGWSAKDYCTKDSYNTYTNAFWNSTTGKFDFSYYMSNNNFPGVDYVFILLGINDVFTATKPLNAARYDEIISYYNEMITSIRAYDSNIKIFVGLPIMPANSAFSNSYNHEIMKAERLGLIQRLIQEYDNRESDGFVVVPVYCVVDTERDFPTESRPICTRDSSTVEYVTDETHPKTQGYYKIADVMYTYIKYGTTLS